MMRERGVTLAERWEGRRGAECGCPGCTIRSPCLSPRCCSQTRQMQLQTQESELRTLLELAGLHYPALAVSAISGQALGEIGAWLFDHLGVVRVYTKAPGKAADRSRPYTLRRDRRWRMLHAWSTRISHDPSNMRACGERPASRVSRSDPATSLPTATLSNCTADDRPYCQIHACLSLLAAPQSSALEKGKPTERWGRKATGLRTHGL